ncbi:ImmA/IrrE family metallo-endopeptidase [Kribbella sindirgiensis]|uniref:ImmA/IrrE family metallo-endopeptidase n=1 Tax=Kribbella sindirgiensis TaxID=1124744 RepID=A0A4R0J1Y8_9ACTN|nr:ImmA/IrrE family metallo-endopeptidase [Kribbella sindirgiensis]TCC39390.1 ImmA/IrrE family metallo-endopeptidase [Kribbella sindirgiensis]
MHQYNNPEARSVLARLRAFIPQRATDFDEAKKIAELQANRLLSLFSITSGAVPSDIVRSLPRIRVVFEDLPVSGTSHWSGTHWIITLNKGEAPVRQRFTLMHEFKHIIDHGRAHLLYISNSRYTAAEQAERAADHFAGCVLMPKRLLKGAWTRGLQTSSELARHFDVSIPAVEVRLSQTRLNADRDTTTVRPLTARLARGRKPLYHRQLATQGLCP